MSALATGLYSISYHIMFFSSRKIGQYAVNIAYSKLEKTLSFSTKGPTVFVSLEASLESFLISSVNVSDAPEMYS